MFWRPPLCVSSRRFSAHPWDTYLLTTYPTWLLTPVTLPLSTHPWVLTSLDIPASTHPGLGIPIHREYSPLTTHSLGYWSGYSSPWTYPLQVFIPGYLTPQTYPPSLGYSHPKGTKETYPPEKTWHLKYPTSLCWLAVKMLLVCWLRFEI